MAGLEDINSIDLVAESPDGQILLVMVVERPWIDFEKQGTELYEKVSTYLTYLHSGQLVRDNPAAAGKRVNIALHCFARPCVRIQGLIDRITRNLSAAKIGLSVRLYGASFAPHAAVAVMADFDRRWSVAGGWAIDMLLGAMTRDHEGVDIAILRRDQHSLRAYLSDWQWSKIIPGTRPYEESWTEAEYIEPPVHELWAVRNGYKLKYLLNEADRERWVFRRNPKVTLPTEQLDFRVGPANAPVMCPEVVLLYKANDTRPRDEHDFERALPLLSGDQRRWLSDALQLCHPGHPWLSRL